MLRMPAFDVVAPTTVDEAVRALQAPGARAVAGGTDLLPNIKHRIERPTLLVSLSQVEALRRIERDDDAGVLRVGAGVTLTEISEHPGVRELFPSFARAAGLVASPIIRNMGTIGGNLNLDTRCRYVNQTEFWRSAIGGCLKSDGVVCHVVPGGKNCVAAMSSDCVPVLITLDGTIALAGPDGTREVALADYYNANGLRHTNRADGELATEVRIPLPRTPRRSCYAKWTVRQSIDFPLVSVAMRFDLRGDSASAAVDRAVVAIGVLGARPRVLGKLDDVVGKPLSDPAVCDAVCDRAYQQAKPLANVPYDAPYRRKMIPVYARRAFAGMLRE